MVLTIVDDRNGWSSNGYADDHGEDEKTWSFFSVCEMEEERGGGVYVTVCKKISNKRGLCSLGEAIAPGRNKLDASKKEGYNRVKF